MQRVESVPAKILKKAKVSNRIRLAPTLLALVLMPLVHNAFTQNVWTGGLADGYIDTPENWQGDVTPDLASGNEMLEFGTGGDRVEINIPVSIAGMVLYATENSAEGYQFRVLKELYPEASLLVGGGGIRVTDNQHYSPVFGFGDFFNISGNQTWDTGSAKMDVMSGFGGNFSITKNGTGDLVIWENGTRSATYAGTILNSGVLELGDAAALSLSPDAPLVLNGGVLVLAQNNDLNTVFTGTNITVTGDSSIETKATNLNAVHPLYTVGNLTIGPQTLTVTRGALATTGTAILQTGDVVLEGNATFHVEQSPSKEVVLSLGGVTGGHGLTKTGNGTIRITANSSFTGATTINSGTFEVGANGRLGGGNYSANIANAGSFVFFGNSIQTLCGVVSGNGTLVHNGAGTLLLGGNNTFTGSLSIGSAIFEIAPTGRLGGGNFSANISNEGTLRNSSNFSQTLSGFLTGNGGLTQNGASTLLLTRNNTYTGATTIHSGTISLPLFSNAGVAGPLGNSTNSADNLVFSGGTLLYTGANATTDRNFTLANGAAGTIGVGNSSSTLTMTGSSAATTGSLDKSGPGTLVLNGNANHSGGTTVSSGTLRINGNHNGAVSVEAGASLGGGGSIDSLATLNAGASLQPGNTVGTMTFNGGLLLHNGSNTTMEINSDATYDRISVTGGTITYGGQLNLFFGFTPATPTTFNLFYGTQAGDSSFSAITFSGPVDSTGYGFNYATGELTVVPEPAPLALLGLSAIVFLWILNRKKRETV